MMKSSRKHCQAGVTLLELLIVMSIMVVLMGALRYAFTAELDMQRLHAARRTNQDQTVAFETRLTRLIEGAKLTADTTDATSFFQGIQSTNSTQIGTDDIGCDQLTFTTTAPGTPLASVLSQDDFETQQDAHGPVGGVAEVSLSTTPVGEAATGTGLFERIQQPSDGDPTQGGTESLIAPQIDRIGFQFWNGLQWVDTWDTVTSIRRLPEAVKVSYTTTEMAATGTVRTFVVGIPTSDVTDQDPVDTTTGT